MKKEEIKIIQDITEKGLKSSPSFQNKNKRMSDLTNILSELKIKNFKEHTDNYWLFYSCKDKYWFYEVNKEYYCTNVIFEDIPSTVLYYLNDNKITIEELIQAYKLFGWL